jgi:hypothetical protein
MTPTPSVRLLRPRRPVIGSTPRVAPRCGACVAVRVPFHLRQNRRWSGSGPDPAEAFADSGSHAASGEPAAIWGPIRVQQGRSRLGFPDSPPAEPAAIRDPCPHPASRRGPGLHSWDRQGQSRSGSKVRASRWYEHQEALELRRLGDAPLDLTGSPTPPTPSPGRRRESPRGVDLRTCPAPISHRQAGGRSEL